jgi:hypothetical protein
MRDQAGPGGRISVVWVTGNVDGWHPPTHPGPGQPKILVEAGHVMPRMTGAKFMIQMMPAYGMPHVFYKSETYAS